MGEDVGRYGGTLCRVARACWTSSARSAFATRRFRSSAFVGAGIGAALGGMRPIVEIMTVNFSLLALDQIVNNAATAAPHVGRAVHACPLVIRMATGAGRQLAAQHSHSLEGWYAHIPGITRPRARHGRRRARHAVAGARRTPTRSSCSSTRCCTTTRASCRQTPAMSTSTARESAGRARDVTLVTYGGSLCKSLEAAEQLAAEGIECRGHRPARRCGRWTCDRDGVGAAHPPCRGDRRGLEDAAAWRRRSWRASWSRPSTISMRPSRVCAAKRCRCRTRSIWRKPRCRSRRRSWPPSRRCSAQVTRCSSSSMPSLGADMDEGTLLEWKVQPGDTVKRATSSRSSIRRRPPSRSRLGEGTVHALVTQPGRDGARRGGDGLAAGTGRAGAEFVYRGPWTGYRERRPATADRLPSTGERRPSAADRLPSAGAVRRPASPAARRRALDMGIELAAVEGTGVEGSITLADVERAARAPAALPSPAGDAAVIARDRSAEMRRTIGAAMARAKREIPHYYLAERIPLAAASEWLLAYNAGRPVTERLLMAVLLLKAVARAARRVPRRERCPHGRCVRRRPAVCTSGWRSRYAAAA